MFRYHTLCDTTFCNDADTAFRELEPSAGKVFILRFWSKSGFVENRKGKWKH
jgi:hypothetical protein